MNKIAKKSLKIAGIALGVIVSIFLLLYAFLWLIRGIAYGESMELREEVCTIPELGDGFVPQGICYDDVDTYIMTGYDGTDTTRFYLVNDDGYKRVRLAGKDGKELIGHGGGVACEKDYVYIANGSALTVYSLSSLKNAKGDELVPCVTVFNVDNNAAFVFTDGDNLFVGEFYRKQNYHTLESHYYTTPNDQQNKAIVSKYALRSDGLLINDDGSLYPEYCISVTDLVQGFAVRNGTYILSRSYGLANSHLEYYSAPKDSGKTISVTFKNDPDAEKRDVPLYYLDDSSLVKTIALPSFSEDLDVIGDRVIVTTEAACNKYIVGKLFGATKVFAYPI